jgi:N-acetylneuraminic acid mutarotase
MRALLAALAPIGLAACEVFSGYSDPGYPPPADSSVDAGGDTPQDAVTTDSGHDVSDADVVADTGPADTCDCTPGTTAKVAGGTCPIAGDEQRHTCGTDCKWEAPFCLTPSGWRKIADPPSALAGRFFHTAVWTGSEMIVWGGTKDLNLGFADGASYSLDKDTWTMLPAAPIAARGNHSAIWTGKVMIVWGGTDYGGTYFADGAAYDPSAKSWKTIAATTLAGRRDFAAGWVSAPTHTGMVVWGGASATSPFADGGEYDPGTDTWRTISTSPLSARWNAPFGVVPNVGLIVWGGAAKISPSCPADCLIDGATYDPSADTWASLAVGGPSMRLDASYATFDVAVPNGDFVVWGGETAPGTTLADGARGDTSGWSAVPTPGLALPTGAARSLSLAWGGAGKFWIWSGQQGVNVFDDGAAFDPGLGTWSAIAGTAPIKGRVHGTVEWTGKSAIVWGGVDSTGTAKNDGAILVP